MYPSLTDPMWIQQEAPADGACGGCADAQRDRLCPASALGQPCAAPALQGAPEQIRLVMASLAKVIDADAGRSIVELQLVKALRIEAGEAELTVTFSPRCGNAKHLAEDAFQTLRRVLPDTDIYVRHAT